MVLMVVLRVAQSPFCSTFSLSCATSKGHWAGGRGIGAAEDKGALPVAIDASATVLASLGLISAKETPKPFA